MKKVYLLLVLVFTTISISAQEGFAVIEEDITISSDSPSTNWGYSNGPGRNATFVKNGFWDNWFIGAGYQGNVYFGTEDKEADFMNRLTGTPTIQFGKWYNPYLGGRVKVAGGSLHNFVLESTSPKDVGMIHSKFVDAEVDFMWNFTNYIMSYKENRLYNFIPYIGMGAIWGWDYKYRGQKLSNEQKTLTLNAGIINNFRLTNRLSLQLEVGGKFVRDGFDTQRNGKRAYSGIANASANVVYKVGKVGFGQAVLMDQGLIDDLNNQINGLRDENAKLALRPESCPKVKDCPKCPEVAAPAKATSFVSNAVFFNIGSASIQSEQQGNIYNTAKYLQDNPKMKVKVVGYADKQTGTGSFNMQLSEKRAKNVANELINKYKIASDRVVVEWKGDTVQPYAENDWNRVVLFFTE